MSSSSFARSPAFRRWGGLGLAALLYVAFTFLCLRPGGSDLGSAVAPDPGDPVFNLSLLKRGAEQWKAGLPDYWNAPFFYPLERTITLSDHLLGPAAFVALFTAVLPNPIAAYNFLFLSSFALSALATWWVLRQSGLSWMAAFAGGLVFAFSPYRMDQRSHLQILLAACVPLTLWAWDRLLAERTGKRAAVFLAFYSLHVSGGNYLAYMIHLPMAAILAVRARELRSDLLTRRSILVLAPVAVACTAILAAIFHAYLQPPPGLEISRSPEEWRIWGASLASFLTPSPGNWYFGGPYWSLHRPENTLFAGFAATALAAAGVLALWRSREPRPAAPLTARRHAVLVVLAGAAATAWVFAEVHTWTGIERFSLLGEPFGLHGYRRPGLLLGLAVVLAVLLFRRWAGRWPRWTLGRTAWERGLFAAGWVSALLCFPIAFVPLASVLPGLDRMRVATRFYTFASLAIAWLAALGLDRLRQHWPGRRGAVVAGILLLAIGVELVPRDMAWNWVPRQNDLEPVYQWLGQQDGVRAVLELPAGDVMSDIGYLYRQSFHGKPLVNGYSGFIPPGYQALAAHCCHPMPDDEALAMLRDLGVSHVVVHPPRRWGPIKRRQVEELGERPGITQVFAGGTRHLPVVVFEIADGRPEGGQPAAPR